jgi:hypothetical protein
MSHFDYINFKASLIIICDEILNMAHLVMLVIFHMNVINVQFNVLIFMWSSIFEVFTFWIFKVLNFHIFEIVIFFNVSNKLLSSSSFLPSTYFYYTIFLKVPCKNVFFNNRIFHFQKSFIKPKLKIGSNGFFIWFFWHSYVLKRNIVPWLPWFQMVKNK